MLERRESDGVVALDCSRQRKAERPRVGDRAMRVECVQHDELERLGRWEAGHRCAMHGEDADDVRCTRKLGRGDQPNRNFAAEKQENRQSHTRALYTAW